MSRDAERISCPRRGSTTGQFLAALSLLAGLAGAAVIIAPGTLRAQPDGFAPIVADHADHQRVIELLSGLVSRCHAVIGVYPRTNSPFVEALLWLHDQENQGLVDPGEIGLLSHSEVSHTISFRTLRSLEHKSEQHAALMSWSGEASWDPALISTPDFCTWWRCSDLIESRTIGRGISDLQLAWIGHEQAERRGLEITLTWSDDSSDSSDQASTMVAVHRRIPGVQE